MIHRYLGKEDPFSTRVNVQVRYRGQDSIFPIKERKPRHSILEWKERNWRMEEKGSVKWANIKWTSKSTHDGIHVYPWPSLLFKLLLSPWLRLFWVCFCLVQVQEHSWTPGIHTWVLLYAFPKFKTYPSSLTVFVSENLWLGFELRKKVLNCIFSTFYSKHLLLLWFFNKNSIFRYKIYVYS